jgi:hypothetical protein
MRQGLRNDFRFLDAGNHLELPATARAGFVTGVTPVVDGGFTIRG